jgi:hypothetical protein
MTRRAQTIARSILIAARVAELSRLALANAQRDGGSGLRPDPSLPLTRSEIPPEHKRLRQMLLQLVARR